MNRADKIRNNLFYLVAGSVYAYALAAVCLSCTYIRIFDGRVLMMALLAMAFFCLWFYNRHTFWIGLCLILGSALFTWLYLHSKDYAVDWFRRLVPYLADLIAHIRGLSAYYERYAVLGPVIIGGFALVTAAAIRSRGGFYLLSLMGFGVFGLVSYLQYYINPGYLVCFLFVFITLLARRLSRSAARAGGDLAINVSGLMLLPICLVLIWIAGLLPQPQAASSRSIRDNVTLNLSALDEFFYGTFTPKYFSFATTGFSPSGSRLGGNVTPNERYVMEVYTPTGERPYLAGAYKNSYGGDRWDWSQPESALPVLEADAPYPAWSDLGGMELVLDIYFKTMGQTPITRADFWKLEARQFELLTIYPGRATRSVFAPAESILARHWAAQEAGQPRQESILPLYGSLARLRDASGLPTEPGLVFRRTSQGAVEAQATMAVGTSYTVGYMPASLHKTSSGIVRDDWADYGYTAEPQLLDEGLLPYLELPETLPQRVRDLAQAIVDEAGAQNPYAKMRALEQYLHQFPYTLTPGPVPGEVDFVDYFLFEGQQGYCTYYATALAVMGRCVGVPTRYAEGFVLPREQNDQGGYDVTNAQAHAWCEAFLSVTGWTAFEATAPYAQAFYSNGEEVPAHDTYDAMDYPAADDFLEDDLMAGVRDRDSRATEPTQAEVDEEPDAGGRMGFFLLTLLGLVLAAAGVLGGRYWLYQQRMNALEALPNREAALAYYRRILGLLTARGAPLAAGETADAYGARLDGARGGGPHHSLAVIFCRAAYSPHPVTDDDRAALAEGYRQLLARADASPAQRAQAFVERYVLGKY